ncbi:hypothetical protein KN1_06720 [Stygiolobus caldivivus]|uniref:Uncharacterized protein n=1 Tax=Stygiolobus caldivivus TaxID=2824673 RepID=A0A8D5ZIF7_9CREN|nr:hypothetical protein KN1_06720 [Stygiolobus caldivivus]
MFRVILSYYDFSINASRSPLIRRLIVKFVAVLVVTPSEEKKKV